MVVLDWVHIGEMGESKLTKRKIGLILDGETEIKAIPQRLCEKKCEFVKRKRRINGNTATIKKISVECIKLLKSISATGVELTIIIIDREDKSETAAEMGKKISLEISKVFCCNFIVVIADMMFENWLIADIEKIKLKYPSLIKDNVKNTNYEGKHGEGEIKNNWKGENKYKKTIHGPQFFKTIRIEEAKKNSQSFCLFITKLAENNIVIY